MKTAEFVTPKHPDKMCDRIADAILDECLRHDHESRVAVEVMGGHGKIYIIGEVTSPFHIDEITLYPVVGGITYPYQYGLLSHIQEQSFEIARGVDTGGAGDQGIMRGYAVSETPSLMPIEYDHARSLCKFLYESFPYDGKTQVTVDDNNQIKVIVASFKNTTKKELEDAIREWLGDDDGIEAIHANPAGDWSNGGFDADTGLTGRKLMVDNYGPRFPIGGGSFSGKDASKVDRSGAYMARKIAVDYLRTYNAKEVSVELAYAIGVAEPVDAFVKVDGKEYTINRDAYDLTPNGIISFLGLKNPLYAQTAEWGHFGNGFAWDK